MLEKEYLTSVRRKGMFLLGSILILIILSFLFVMIGLDGGFGEIYYAVGAFLKHESLTVTQKIILFLRFPRVIMAIFAGIGLGVSGAVMQSLSRNYLVSPFTLGISSAAAFGASLAIVFGAGTILETELGTIACAFLSSVLCIGIVFSIAQRMGFQPVTIVLVGISLNYFFGAMTAMIEFFAKQHKLEAVVQWTFGTFNKASWESIIVCGGILLVCCFFLIRRSLQFDIIAANEDEMVRSLGINPVRLRCVGGLLAVLMTASIISFTGVIGFVGLISPHMTRLLVGVEHRFFLPLSGTIGALLLLVSDTLGRLIIYPVNIPVGIVVSFLGVPLFLHLILSLHRKGVS